MASATHTSDNAMAQDHHEEPTACRLLSLPAELRNWIYELTFTTPDTDEVDLLNTSPPSKCLLTTCRQIGAEATALYKSAFRHYWKTSHFVVNGNRTELASHASAVKFLEEHDVENISTLSFRAPRVTLTSHNGTWIDHVDTLPDIVYGIVKESDVDTMLEWSWQPGATTHYDTGLGGSVMQFVDLSHYPAQEAANIKAVRGRNRCSWAARLCDDDHPSLGGTTQAKD
ncbi:hypothetical protein LTR85_005421 [Meristemomyces frigidus]|nr:hypothetical protein LTR85_005421 [Meristemomyces frigidus]